MNRTAGVVVAGCVWSLAAAAGWSDPPPSTAAPKAAPVKWRPLWDGKSLKNWAITDYGGQGDVEVNDGVLVMQQGSEITGIHWTGEKLPTSNYEISLEAQRIDGSDFFCGLVFPVKTKHCSFVVGGWGGGVVGLSAIDGLYAADNDTATYHTFKPKQWYRIRLRVADDFLCAWIDDEEVVNVDLKGREVSLHPAVELAKPLGISCFSTVAGLKDIKIRDLVDAERKTKPVTPEKKPKR
ncbi:MAG: DUF1080 domain-containing protein [Planctomycetaceae bacterium]|nr:DUF1080 domain-containing protein [Planctomycetaceae bacterium]